MQGDGVNAMVVGKACDNERAGKAVARPGVFDSDQVWEIFLADLHASRPFWPGVSFTELD